MPMWLMAKFITCYGHLIQFISPFTHQVFINCHFSLRACAAAALKDVSIYFTKEQGQVAVSKRTSENVPLNYLTFKKNSVFL